MIVPAVAARGVGVRVGSRPILADVDLTVRSGDWCTIIGPNGAGKSTLLGAIAGVVQASGTIDVHGIALAGLSPRARARALALVVQTPLVPRGLTVVDYVALGRTPHGRRLGVADDQDRCVVDQTLERLALGEFAGRRVDSLSGGERQRAVIARAIAQQAPVLLLDEPTAALDIGYQQDVLDLVDELRHDLGLTVIATMHDLTLCAQYADQVALLADGRLVASGHPLDLIDADRLGELYGARVEVLTVDGRLIVVPARHRRTRSTKEEPDD